MLPITGYTDRLSAAPGGRIAFKVSSLFDEPYQADLIRIVHGDPNPAGPGLKYEDHAADFAGAYPSRLQPVHLGSYARIDDAAALAGALDGVTSFTAMATIWPTLPDQPQAVLSRLDGQGRGFTLAIGAAGAEVTVSDAAGEPVRIAVARPLIKRAWYRIWARFDADTGMLAVGQSRLRPEAHVDDSGRAEAVLSGAPAFATAGPLLLAARQGRSGRPVTDHFNGKLERPSLFARALSDEALASAHPTVHPDSGSDGLVASWDFSHGTETADIHDIGPHGLRGTLVNLPARAMMGSTWSGREMCWRHAPDDYAAIHFHEDDIHDCGWQTDFAFEVPAGMRSGVYGARLRCRDAEEIIPFYVRPPTGTAQSKLAFLASTFTYQVYANHRRGNADRAYRTRVADWGARPWNPDDHSDYGHSTYNVHTDGSGICYSSRLRPIVTMRPNYLTFHDLRGSGLRHFPADTHILDWLEAMGHGYDVVTDEDLDDEGPALLAPYKAVITGSHPEYHTTGTLDALQTFTQTGGRLVYMGGNGFYWRVARSESQPGALEIRRGEGGIRTWAADPGEYYHSFDGTYGGLWRRNGRPPQALAGIGFSSQGSFEGAWYRRTPGADDPRTAWIFEGVDDDVIGNFGLSGGGAAGFELDRADRRLGTPENAIVLASSEGHSENFVVVPEDMLNVTGTTSGEPAQRLIRADMVYFDVPGGGAVFSTGAITFAGSLSHNSYDNNVSRIVDNVVTRFVAD